MFSIILQFKKNQFIEIKIVEGIVWTNSDAFLTNYQLNSISSRVGTQP